MAVKFYQDGKFHLLAGAKVYHNGTWVTLSQTAKIWLNNAWHALWENVSSGVVVNGIEYVSSGWIYLDTTANGYGNILYVSSGGTAIRSTINNRGSMHVDPGGTADSVTLTGPYSYMHVYGGIQNLTVSSGGNVLLDGSASKVNIASDGVVNVYHQVNDLPPGYIEQVHVSSGGYLWIHSGGTATNITISSGGSVYVSSGGTATDVTMLLGGRIYAEPGGTLIY